MFRASNLQQASFNFERIHGLGFCYDMIPAIKRLYPLKEDQVAALRRHLVFFNTTPAVCGPVIGVTAAMEEARANGAEIDDGTIGLAPGRSDGTIGRAGDPLVQNAAPDYRRAHEFRHFRGNILGPRCSFIFNVVRLAMKWYGLQPAFAKNIVSDMGGNLLQKLTEGASILGLFVMGVLVTNGRQSTYRWCFTNACRRCRCHRHHNRAEHPRPTLPWFAGARSDAADGSSAQQKINPVWLIFICLV